jgi:methionyl aminopeptidase
MRSSFTKKSDADISAMIPAGLLTATALAKVREAIKPGITTLELDAIAEDTIRSGGGVPNFQLVPGYKHTICVSVNDEIVHGIPGDRQLQPGDIVSVDCGALVDGWNGDRAITVIVPGEKNPARQTLSDVTYGSLWEGIAALYFGKRLNHVGVAIEDFVEKNSNFGILEQYVGHGIGRSMHEDPPVYNFGVRERLPKIVPGLVVAIEPMLTAGSNETFVAEDDWTVKTTDGSDGAHWEHSIAVHSKGLWVLTAEDGGESELAKFGIKAIPPKS